MARDVHLPLCNFLQSIALQPAFAKQALIELPRSFLKTTICSTDFPLWLAIQESGPYDHWQGQLLRALICQNTVKNAEARVHELRGNVMSSNFIATFPDYVPDTRNHGSKWSDQKASLKRETEWPEATFNAAGVGSSTGTISAHYGLRILDDLCTPKKDEMTGDEIEPAPEDVEHAIGFYKTVHELALDEQKDIELIVGTPYTLYDLSAYIRQNEPWVKRFKIPAWLPADCFPVEKNFDPFNPPSDAEVRNAWENNTGGPTYPSRFPREALERKLIRSGTYIFYTQFLLLPVDPTQTRFTREIVSTWKSLPADLVLAIIVDPATEKKTSADTGIIVVGFSPYDQKMYVVETLLRRIGMLDTGIALIDLIKKYKLQGKYKLQRLVIETVAYQDALREYMQKLTKEAGINIWVDGITPVSRSRKDDRIKELEPFLARGELLVGPGQTQLIQQLVDFPYSPHKDLADCLAYAPKVFGHDMLIDRPAEPLKRGLRDYKFEIYVDDLLKECSEKHKAGFYSRDE